MLVINGLKIKRYDSVLRNIAYEELAPRRQGKVKNFSVELGVTWNHQGSTDGLSLTQCLLGGSFELYLGLQRSVRRKGRGKDYFSLHVPLGVIPKDFRQLQETAVSIARMSNVGDVGIYTSQCLIAVVETMKKLLANGSRLRIVARPASEDVLFLLMWGESGSRVEPPDGWVGKCPRSDLKNFFRFTSKRQHRTKRRPAKKAA